MKPTCRTPLITLVLAALLSGCSANAGHGESAHEDEESGTWYGAHETYDAVRNGVQLTLTYDANLRSFQGTVRNTTERTLERVRVEVHLSNGEELGPTTPADLAPGAQRDVTLAAGTDDFERWNAHPEVGSEEHGHEQGGEHGGEGAGEHGGEHAHEHD